LHQLINSQVLNCLNGIAAFIGAFLIIVDSGIAKVEDGFESREGNDIKIKFVPLLIFEPNCSLEVRLPVREDLCVSLKLLAFRR
jgi:hypothetical protein